MQLRAYYLWLLGIIGFGLTGCHFSQQAESMASGKMAPIGRQAEIEEVSFPMPVRLPTPSPQVDRTIQTAAYQPTMRRKSFRHLLKHCPPPTRDSACSR